MPLIALNASTATLVVPAAQDRRFLYLENTGSVDVRWGWDATVTMTGSTTGMLLRAGAVREYAVDAFGPAGKAIYAIAESGTPSINWNEGSA